MDGIVGGLINGETLALMKRVAETVRARGSGI